METMHAAGRRRLPPVPRSAAERPTAGVLTVDEPSPVECAEAAVEETSPNTNASDVSDTAVIDTKVISTDLIEAELARLVEQTSPEDAAAPETGAVAGEAPEQDPAQEFVARLRTAASDFAGAAAAESAVVREAVPPARHRRARCRLVLRYADGREVDVTMLGPAGTPGRPSRHGFDRQILRWLGAGLLTDDAWMVSDLDAPGGIAVDLTAWATST
jgi:hypothetical protein